MRYLLVGAVIGMTLVFPSGQARAAAGDETTVHVVLFYSPTCPHCHTVVEQVIRPLMAEYGERFRVISLNTFEPTGRNLFVSALTHLSPGQQRRAVPTLVIGDRVLIGGEILGQLPELVRMHMEHGGVGVPAIPGLAEALAPTRAEPTAPEPTPEPASPSGVEAASSNVPR